ncbi:MAG: SWIM zinc finger family protein, partial [Prevotellaceae bacterium]|nr:SWIM zinc finger family protein [Prevotellaceae bacterium]
MNDIIDLQETSPNHWRAKYQGNYGVYTIKIAYGSNGKTSDFSCSCPSDYYPCKHIGMVKEAIAEHISKSQNSVKVQGKALTVEELLKDVTLQELRDFVVRQAMYNPDLTNAVTLEFARKLTNVNTNVYSAILRKAMKEVDFDYEDYYENEEGFDLDVLDQWLEKAQTYVEQKNCSEAVLICKACIEEFAEWLQTADTEVCDYLNDDYKSRPFEIMKEAVANSDVNMKELYAYCLSEMGKDKYSGTEMFDKFNDLLSILAMRENPDEFIAL